MPGLLAQYSLGEGRTVARIVDDNTGSCRKARADARKERCNVELNMGMKGGGIGHT